MIEFFEHYHIYTRPTNHEKTQYRGPCIFCGDETHFHVNPKNGLWDCKKCSAEGNHQGFITQLHAMVLSQTTDEHYAALAQLRPGINPEVLKAAGLAYDPVEETWYVPYWNGSEFLVNLGTFKPKYGFRIYKGPAPLEAVLFRPFDQKTLKKNVIITEGEWDLLALYPYIKDMDDFSIVAAPGANTFKQSFVEKFHDKNVYILYDKDSAGRKGVSKVCRLLNGVASSVKFLKWDEEPFRSAGGGEDDGKDIRDLVIHHTIEQQQNTSKRKPRLADLIWGAINSLCISVEVDNQSTDTYLDERFTLPEVVPVASWEELMVCYRRNLYLTPGNEHAIACVFAATLSPFFSGEPVWMFFVGPPSSGKTTIIEAFGDSNVYVEAQSQINSKTLVSGQKRGDGKDVSLLRTLPDRTLMIKDFTTVLSMSSFEQIELFGLLRDIFDGTFKRQYGNGEIRHYKSMKFGMIAGVTKSIHALNSSAFGERFLKVEYLDRDEFDEMEHINSALAGMATKEARSKVLLQHTLGYLDHLANNLPEHLPTIAPFFKTKIAKLALLVARLRSQVERGRDDSLLYRPEPEVASRLAVIFTKMAQLLMVVYNKTEVDEHLYATVRKLALDSCIPFNIEFARKMHKYPGGITRSDLSEQLQIPSTNVHRILIDTMQLGIIRMRQVKGKQGRPAELYYLDPFIMGLWEDTVNTGLYGDKRPAPSDRKIDIPRRTRKPRNEN